MKGGHTVLSDFCGMMNLHPPLVTASYARHLKFVSQTTKQEVELLLTRAAQWIRKSILNKNQMQTRLTLMELFQQQLVLMADGKKEV